MTKPSFVHLHVHSEYSLLDGVSRIPELVARAAELKMPAMALTDHGYLHGAIQFYSAAREVGIKPILGCELYMAPRSRFSKETKEDRSPYHLTVLAQNEIGYRNLVHLSTIGSVEGFYSRPRIDREVLEKYAEGLIVLSGCPASEMAEHLLNDRDAEAEKALQFLRDLFPENFYLEVQQHRLEVEKKIFPALAALSKKFKVPLVATNDSHYTHKEDALLQDVMICIQTGKLLEDTHRLKFETPEFYVKSSEEMAQLFADYPEAVAITAAIAEKCNVTLSLGEFHLPDFPVPTGETADSFLRTLTLAGVKRRFGIPTEGGTLVSPDILQRMNMELSVLQGKGLAPYFLIVQDFINFAKQKGIQVGPGRGSAAGSLVAYALAITEVDPLKHGLFFERFLNPERTSLPDIDVDFCFERRPEVLEYVTQKYGVDHVAQIVTFGTMAARAAIRDVGRVLGVPLSRVDRLAKLVPFQPGMTLERAMQMEPELTRFYQEDEELKRLLDLAQRIEGMVRHASVHAAGVVISKEPITEYAPLQKVSDSPQMVTQFPMEDLEKIGLLKMDFLGLRNLTMIGKAVELIREVRGEEVHQRHLPLDDPATFALLYRGETMGIFQLESRGMRQLIRRLQPGSFQDLVASIALFRPGPLESGMVDDFINRKHGRVPLTYDPPDLEPILQETYGTIVYQEQVMEIARRLCGFTLGEADLLRRSMGKKDKKEMAELKEKFVEGAVQHGVSRHKAAHLFNQCSKHAGYSFNKSHATAYAMISYQTAYLKAHFPTEFLAALMTSIAGNMDKMSVYISEARRMEVQVLPPDINESGFDFTPALDRIRFGLAAVKNVGVGAVEAILRERQAHGPFLGIADLSRRLGSRVLNKRAIESLVKAGSFDSLEIDRLGALDKLSEILDAAGSVRGSQAHGQGFLFGLDVASNISEPKRVTPDQMGDHHRRIELLKFEKEILGLYISEHPVQYLQKDFEERGLTPIGDVLENTERRTITVGGIVSTLRKLTTKKGDLMLLGTLEDATGSIPFVVFPSAYAALSERFEADAILVLSGLLDQRNEELQIVVERAEPIGTGPVRRILHVTLDRLPQKNALQALRERLQEYPGEDPVLAHVQGLEVDLGNSAHVSISPELLLAVEEVVGEGGVWIDRAPV